MRDLDTETLYKAFSSRDPRYDGRFYVGVTTTGIYCRPICPARPKQEHVLFFRSKAEAEKAGYRPCLRCRPDLSPASVQWQGTAAVVSRAFAMIVRGEADGKSLGALAARLGMTDRHLRRLFREHLGASPLEVAISHRLHLARQLLTQTRLSITDIALASGFNSLRRFNDAFVTTYRRNPSAFRKEGDGPLANDETISLSIPYIGRYDWDTLMGYFSRHEVPGVDAVEDGCYLRHFSAPGGETFLKVSHREQSSSLEVSLKMGDFSQLRAVVDAVRFVFDVDHNPRQLAQSLASESCTELVEDTEGIRIPGAFDPLEAAVSVILGQGVSLAQGRLNLRKLVERYGSPSPDPHYSKLDRFFPAPQTLASADLTSLGFTKVRACAIRELALAYLEGRLDLSRGCDLALTKKALLQIRGIGPWSVELIALRCLGDTDAFPGSDLIIKRALEKFRIVPEKFSPWRSYLALALWKSQACSFSKAGSAPARTAHAVAQQWEATK